MTKDITMSYSLAINSFHTIKPVFTREKNIPFNKYYPNRETRKVVESKYIKVEVGKYNYAEITVKKEFISYLYLQRQDLYHVHGVYINTIMDKLCNVVKSHIPYLKSILPNEVKDITQTILNKMSFDPDKENEIEYKFTVAMFL